MTGFVNIPRNPRPGLPDGFPWNLVTEPSAEVLLSTADIRALPRGATLDTDFGIVTTGVLAVMREVTGGRRAICMLFHAGDLVDLRRLVCDRQDALTALRPTRFLALDEMRLDHWIEERSDLAQAMAAQLRLQSERMRDHAADLACKTPIERIAALLFELKRWPGVLRVEGGAETLRLPLSRGDIAEYVGTAPETVSRSLRRLERDALIAVGPGDDITLCDIAALRMIAKGGRPRRSNLRH